MIDEQKEVLCKNFNNHDLMSKLLPPNINQVINWLLQIIHQKESQRFALTTAKLYVTLFLIDVNHHTYWCLIK